VVNLAYVINVIEDTSERRQALIEAWQLAESLLIVAAQVLVEHPTAGAIPYGDGIITRRQTFQKYYDQEELKAYIDQVLGVDAIPIALGIYLVFRDQAQAENFRASRWRRRAATPGPRLRVSRFETYRQQLQPLMDFYAERGRLPRGRNSALTALPPCRPPLAASDGPSRWCYRPPMPPPGRRSPISAAMTCWFTWPLVSLANGPGLKPSPPPYSRTSRVYLVIM
jgi:hypothetical protein